jgi:hypothetical protein
LLEGRTLLTATLDANGLLTILGTDQADVMLLKAGPNVGDVALFGVPEVQDGTIFQKVREVTIDALAGDDSIRIDPLGLLQDPQAPTPCFDVGGGPGSDTIEITTLVGAPGYARDFRIGTGDGDNVTRLVFGNGLQGQVPLEGLRIEVQYQSGAGADTLDVEYAGPLEVDFHLTIDTGGGDDTVNMRLTPVGVEPPPPLQGPIPCFDVAITTGAGNDRVDGVMEAFGLIAVPDVAFGIDLGAGHDVLVLNAFAAASPNAEGEGMLQLDVRGGSGHDLIAAVLQSDQALPIGSWAWLPVIASIEAGAGDDVVHVFSQTDQVGVTAPEDFHWDVGVDLGGGNDTLVFDLTTPDSLRLDVRAGAGHDVVNLGQVGVTAPSDIVWDVTIDLGAGDDTLLVELTTPDRLRLDARAGSGDDLMELSLVGLTAPGDDVWDVAIDLSAGDDRLFFDVTTPDRIRLDVSAGVGNDRVDGVLEAFGLIAVPDVAVGIDLGAGDDWLFFDVTTPDRIRLDIQAGSGHDQIIAYSAVVGSVSPNGFVADVVIDLGAGDDFGIFVLHAATPTAGLFRLRMSGGSGDDTLAATLNAHPQGSAVFDAVVAGDSGDDNLALRILGVANPQWVFALIDGGAGYDTATSAGPVKIVKVEEIIP